jgi:hypothetical protein
VTTHQADLIVGFGQDDSGGIGNGTNITVGTGFTAREFNAGYSAMIEDMVQSAATSTAGTFTFARADGYLDNMAAFK